MASEDLEKGSELVAVLDEEERPSRVWSNAFTKKLMNWGVEARGIDPVPLEKRTDTQYHRIFFVWFTGNFNILSFSSGTLGPVVFGLGVRDSCLVILFFNLLCCILPAYFTVWGAKLGLRQMIHARYSFGYYGTMLACVLNLVMMCGFSVLNAILGGQTLASVTDGNLSWTVGIVIVMIISLFVSFCGYSILMWFERFAWIPVFLVFLVALGVGGKHITDMSSTAEPATASHVLSFASTIAGFSITWSPHSSDFTCYFPPHVSSSRIFWYSYLGLIIPIITVQCLGAVLAASASLYTPWRAGYENGDIGGLITAILLPAGGFGKFLVSLLSLSVTGSMAVNLYSFCLNIQTLIPPLVFVPRYVFSVVSVAIVTPLAIVGSHRFYTTITNFLGLIGYWGSIFSAVVLLEHFVFRQNDPAMYDISSWNVARKLSWGVAAVAATIFSFGITVPSIHQQWFVGPIAEKTGDIGFEIAFVATCLMYVPFRALEVRWRGTL